jgi:HSP20 family protein
MIRAYFMIAVKSAKEENTTMSALSPFRGLTTLQDQINRVFNEAFERRGEESNLTTWAPAVDIYETANELVVKGDLPEIDPKDLDIRVENNILTIRGERKFERNEQQGDYLRVERAYGTFSRSFALSNTVNPDAIKAEYQNGVLTLHIPKREEAKPRQIKVNVESQPSAKAAGAK